MNGNPLRLAAPASFRYDLLLVAVCSAATTAVALQYYRFFKHSRCPSLNQNHSSDAHLLNGTTESQQLLRAQAATDSPVSTVTAMDEIRCASTRCHGDDGPSPSTAVSPSPEAYRSCNISAIHTTDTIGTGNNPLHEACLAKDVDALRTACRGALDHESTVAAFTASNAIGYTPLHVAADAGHVECLRELLRYSPDMVKLEVADPRGLTPLAIASGRGHAVCVELLLHAGADPNTASIRGFTTLHLACESGCSCQIIESLLAHGANMESRSRRGSTPLFVAAQQGHVDLVNLLLLRGAFVGATHDSGATPLFVAAQNGHADVVRCLLLHDPNRRISRSTACEGFTPLHVACIRGHTAAVKVMLCFGRCNPDLTSSCGRTALHLAAARGHHEIVELLVREGCQVDARIPSTGETALHLAKKLENGGETVVAALLSAGSSTALKPRSNNIPRTQPPLSTKVTRSQQKLEIIA